MSAGISGVALYFGIVYVAMTEASIFSNHADGYILIAHLLALFLLVTAILSIINSLQSAELENTIADIRLERLEVIVQDMKEGIVYTLEEIRKEKEAEAAKRCACGLAWEHTGRHAPHAKKKTAEK